MGRRVCHAVSRLRHRPAPVLWFRRRERRRSEVRSATLTRKSRTTPRFSCWAAASGIVARCAAGCRVCMLFRAHMHAPAPIPWWTVDSGRGTEGRKRPLALDLGEPARMKKRLRMHRLRCASLGMTAPGDEKATADASTLLRLRFPIKTWATGTSLAALIPHLFSSHSGGRRSGLVRVLVMAHFFQDVIWNLAIEVGGDQSAVGASSADRFPALVQRHEQEIVLCHVESLRRA